jgi:Flp pilus assembly protein TadG
MRAKAKAQSMVEMALLAPLLFTVLFMIVDAGFWIYGYGTAYNAARRASVQAARTPPFPSQFVSSPNQNDKCVAQIIQKATDNALLFDTDQIKNDLKIRYPAGDRRYLGQTITLPENDPLLRYIGGQIEVSVTIGSEYLTPLPRLIGMGEAFTVTATSRRSIENLGLDPNAPDGISCTDAP